MDNLTTNQKKLLFLLLHNQDILNVYQILVGSESSWSDIEYLQNIGLVKLLILNNKITEYYLTLTLRGVEVISTLKQEVNTM